MSHITPGRRCAPIASIWPTRIKTQTCEMGIPLQAAWAMADKLGCSIDLVVGREDIDAPREATLDARAGKLSRSGREMLDDFLRYLEFRDAAIAAQDWR